MRGAVVENGEVVNIIVVEESDLESFGAVDLGKYVAIGDAVVDGVCAAAQEREAEAEAGAVESAKAMKRMERDALLQETDWWSLSDTAAMTQAQIDYRQALRDITDDPNFPDVEFPEKP
jgi:hypothetical protein